MNKKDFAKILAEKTGNTIKDTELFITTFFDTIKEAVKEDKIKFADGVSFETIIVPEKKARNPKTGAPILVPSKKKVKVKLYKGFEVG